MFYTYDKKQLIYKKIRLFKPTLIVLCILSFLTASSYYTGTNHGFERLSDIEKAIVIKKTDEFSKEKMVQMLKDLNVKFPYIVLAQSIQETGHWNSAIFLENHNLFGMKEAQRRITTAEGTNRNHAYYNHWRESVYDYAFYQCRYLSGIRSESEYFEYLNASYAEDSGYVEAIRKVIQKENLKELFN
jgi:flagellum-specific peptidoglycan hydrolase FlgJ